VKYSIAAKRRCSSCCLVSFAGIQGMTYIKLKLQASVNQKNSVAIKLGIDQFILFVS
jgi:hypothetical protein